MQTIRNIKLIIAYEGTSFYGWQRTETGPSIQGALEETIATILQTKVKIEGASRTDRGVHAKGQVASFSLPFLPNLDKVHISLCQLLPREIAIISIQETDPSFHATLSAKEKIYSYRLTSTRFQMPENRLFEWHLPGLLDQEAMHEACKLLTGRRDFMALTNKKKNETYKDTIRDLSLFTFTEKEGRFLFTLRGTHFLYKMARNLVGIAVAVGKQKIALHEIEEILEQRKRTHVGVSAPAHGLTLEEVIFQRNL